MTPDDIPRVDMQGFPWPADPIMSPSTSEEGSDGTMTRAHFRRLRDEALRGSGTPLSTQASSRSSLLSANPTLNTATPEGNPETPPLNSTTASLVLRLQMYSGRDILRPLFSTDRAFDFYYMNKLEVATQQHFQLRHLLYAPSPYSVFYSSIAT